jgi:manganese oxidase
LQRDNASSLANAWTVQGHVNAFGPMSGANLLVKAGGANEIALDYLLRSQSSFLFDGGVWGLLRVLPAR